MSLADLWLENILLKFDFKDSCLYFARWTVLRGCLCCFAPTGMFGQALVWQMCFCIVRLLSFSVASWSRPALRPHCLHFLHRTGLQHDMRYIHGGLDRPAYDCSSNIRYLLCPLLELLNVILYREVFLLSCLSTFKCVRRSTFRMISCDETMASVDV